MYLIKTGVGGAYRGKINHLITLSSHLALLSQLPGVQPEFNTGNIPKETKPQISHHVGVQPGSLSSTGNISVVT